MSSGSDAASPVTASSAPAAAYPDFTTVAARTVPAVANISSVQVIRRPTEFRLREAKRRIKTLEQEVEVLRRAAAYFSQAHLPGK